MSQGLVHCTHCGLRHSEDTKVCPTTGLKLNRQRPKSRSKKLANVGESESGFEEMLGNVIVGEFRIERQLGAGGMGAVFEAVHLPSKATVALKMLQPSLVDDSEAIDRMKREAEVVRAINHPNVCKVLDRHRGDHRGPFLVMELLHGRTLAELLSDRGPMEFWELGPILVQVLSALDAAHGRGFLHRDMKPENIFVTTENAGGGKLVKLLDFGVSKSMNNEDYEQRRLTHTGMVMGTPYYMAPEQARGDSRLDQRVDLWAVGVIMYEMLTGKRPFVANNYNALLVKILTVSPTRLRHVSSTISLGVESIVGKSMDKIRDNRFQYASEMAHSIIEVLKSEKRRPRMAVSYQSYGLSNRAPANTRAERVVARRTLYDDEPRTLVEEESEKSVENNQGAGFSLAEEQRHYEEMVSLDDDLPETYEATIKERSRLRQYERSLPAGTGQTGKKSFQVEGDEVHKDEVRPLGTNDYEEDDEPTLAIRRKPGSKDKD